MEFLVERPTNNKVMKTGPRFKVSSERLEERGIESATPGMQDYHQDEPYLNILFARDHSFSPVSIDF